MFACARRLHACARDVLGHKGSSDYKTISFFCVGWVGGVRPGGVVVHSNCLKKKISCLHTEFLSIL